MFELVYLNNYGDTAQQWSAGAGVHAEYQRYLAARCDSHVQLWLMKHI